MINDFDIELYRMKHGGRALVDYSSAIVNRFYVENKEIMNAVDVIEGLILSDSIVNNTYVLDPRSGLINSFRDFEVVRNILYRTYGLRLVLP